MPLLAPAHRRFLFNLVVTTSAALVGCGSPAAPSPAATPAITSLVIRTYPDTLVVTEPMMVHAFAVYSNGSMEPVTAAWASSDPSVLTVEPSLTGMTAFLTPVSLGTALVTARAGGRSAQLVFTVVSVGH